MMRVAVRRKVKAKEVPGELLPGVTTALLKELHLLTRAGELNADSLRKLKQVNHLLRLLTPAMEDVLGRFGEPWIVDCGAGKGYLGFLLHEVFLAKAGKGTVLGIESRPELAGAAEALAGRMGMSRIRFLASDVEPLVSGAGGESLLPARVHVVTALHACDTATDDAMLLAIRRNADHLALVPCCQAEVARQLEGSRDAAPEIAALYRHPWHRREFGSHLTNAIRALVLESNGYKVTVTELTGWEHSLKNELILARKTRGSDRAAGERLEALLEATGVRPKIVRDLAASQNPVLESGH